MQGYQTPGRKSTLRGAETEHDSIKLEKLCNSVTTGVMLFLPLHKWWEGLKETSYRQVNTQRTGMVCWIAHFWKVSNVEKDADDHQGAAFNNLR